MYYIIERDGKKECKKTDREYPSHPILMGEFLTHLQKQPSIECPQDLPLGLLVGWREQYEVLEPVPDDGNLEWVARDKSEYDKYKDCQGGTVTRIVMVPDSTINLTTTQRGFDIGKFKDRNGEDCSIQKSSVATEYCIWLGCDKGDRMHLSVDMVNALLPLLKTFSETGELK